MESSVSTLLLLRATNETSWSEIEKLFLHVARQAPKRSRSSYLSPSINDPLHVTDTLWLAVAASQTAEIKTVSERTRPSGFSEITIREPACAFYYPSRYALDNLASADCFAVT